jgi:hypothetical protein
MKPTHTTWPDCFPKLTNGELRALYRADFTNGVQLQIVLFILTQTRGTGRIMAGEMDGAGFNEWQEVRDTYGRDAAPLFRNVIAGAIRRHDKQVARELRRLIAAGVVVEHEKGWKGKPAVLSVDLEPRHWRMSMLHTGTNPLPKVNTTNSSCGNESAPEQGNESAPESEKCGNESAPLFKRRKRETLTSSYEEETSEPRHAEERGSDESDLCAGIVTPQLRNLARDLMAKAAAG